VATGRTVTQTHRARSPRPRRALLAATADLLEQVNQAVDASGTGAHQPQSVDQALDIYVVQGDAWTSWRGTLSWIVALRAMGLSRPGRTVLPASASHLRPHEIDHDRWPILLVIGIGLVVAPDLELGSSSFAINS
jgi:hypothetical protein